MKIIGAGFGRTGTLSLYTALSQLVWHNWIVNMVLYTYHDNKCHLWANQFMTVNNVYDRYLGLQDTSHA